jgi:AhpD family alkylhydroperoxidase
MIRLSFDQGLLVHLDLPLAELVAMAVSQQNSCRYCYGTQRALLKILGRSEAQVLETERLLTERVDDPRTAAALTFARRMSRADPLLGRDEKEQLLAAGFTAEQLREIAYVVANLEFANRTTTIMAIPPYYMETVADRWWLRLARPFLARSIRGRVRTGHPEPAPPPYAGPYAYVVSSFSGSPIARAIVEALENAWSSPELTRRSKGLLFAVVAKALDCDLAAQAAREVLSEEGLDARDLAGALEHLSSRAFTPLEQALVSFARETVWYQPAVLQRRARSLLDHVTPEQFVASIGIVALANAFCRLGATLADDA